MSLIEWYFKLHQELEQEYGDSTCVLVQVGKFYEVYEYDPSFDSLTFDEDEYLTIRNNRGDRYREGGIGKASEIGKLLNMKLTSKCKDKPHSMDNPFMIGFPTPAFDVHKDLIIRANYSLTRVDQKPDNPSERVVVKTYSVGTDITSTSANNRIVSIYIECQNAKKQLQKSTILCGLASIDICTGDSSLCEIYSKENDESYALHEIYRFLETYRPKELIIHLNKVPADKVNEYESYLEKNLELSRYSIKVVKSNSIKPHYFTDSYQESVLSKAFSNGMQGTRMMYDLNIELFSYGRVAYVLLLQYCHEHDPKIIEMLRRPTVGWTDEDKYLVLTHNAINQLNLEELLKILDVTSTDLGSRELRKLIMAPTTDVDLLNAKYNMVEELVKNPSLLDSLKLKGLPDIEKLQRRAQIKIIKPKEMINLITGYTHILDLYTKLFQFERFHPLLIPHEHIVEFNEIFAELWSTFTTGPCIFKPGRETEVDDAQQSVEYLTRWKNAIVEHLNQFISSGRGKGLVCEEEGSSGWVMYTTSAKANTLRNSAYNQELCGYLEVSTVKSKSYIGSSVINSVITSLDQYSKHLETLVNEKYMKYVEKLSKCKFFDSITRFVANLDISITGARLAIKYNYKRPTISGAEASEFIIKNMRHPLIERIIRTEYIPNDLEIKQSGLLLYGVNSTGKTSLAKAVGCVVVMAQAGMFVPGELTYRPFKKIITRLSGGDDIIKGQSSFVVEMNEVNTFLRNSDQYTLVLGDELCRGTESLSGIAITVSAMMSLKEKKASYIFSTHMHQLPDMKRIKEMNVDIKHLSTRFDEIIDELVYDRKLADGPGSSLYGLEVCKSLGMEKSFIEKAMRIRRELEGITEDFVSGKRSKYNSGVYVDKCSMCEKTFDLHTHHVREQGKADERGFIDHVPKNAAYNLMVLCSECHVNLHTLKKTVHQIQTMQGIRTTLL